MKKIFLIAWVLFFASCEPMDRVEPVVQVSWRSLGLDNHVVNQIKTLGNLVFVTTDQGFYKGNYMDENPEWTLLGFSGKKVQAALILNEQTYVISVIDRQNLDQPSLYKTTNGGGDWINFQNGFGGDMVEPVLDLVKDPENSQIWYATGDMVVAKSDDAGQSWNPVYGNWQGFASGVSMVRVNPHNRQHIWAGGQNAIEQGYLLRTTNGGDNWDEMFDLLPPPTVAKEMVFHPSKPNTIFSGFEGGLLKTTNNGNNWNTVIDSHEDNRFFFGIVIDPSNPSIVYTGGWLKRFDEPQPFIIYRSTNEGVNWHPYENGEVDFGGVYDMVWAGNEQQKRLLVGLYKGGIFEVIFN
jgi:hypothetical protein